MKTNYQKPQVEVVEIEIEDVVLSASFEPSEEGSSLDGRS